jgi:hypothetical protein
MNDSFMPGMPQKVTWSVTDETSGQLLAGDAFEITVDHGFNATRTIRFNTPNATYPHHLVLNLKSQMQGLPQGDYSAQYRFTVNPKTE